MHRDRENRTVGVIGVVERAEEDIEPEKMADPQTPEVMWMELDHPAHGTKATEVRRTEVFSLSNMLSSNPDYPHFVAVVMGIPGESGFYAPLDAVMAERMGAAFTKAAADLRVKNGEVAN